MPAVKKAVAKKAVKKVAEKPAVMKVVAKKAAVKKAPNAAFMKPVKPDAALAAIVGATPLPRTEITKKLWEYIKKNKLQDEKNKRNINADDFGAGSLGQDKGIGGAGLGQGPEQKQGGQ